MTKDNQDFVESQDNSYMFVDEDSEDIKRSRESKPKGRYVDKKVTGDISEESTINLVADEDVSKEVTSKMSQGIKNQPSFSERLEKRAENITEVFDQSSLKAKDDLSSVALSNDKVVTKGMGFGVASLVLGVLSLTFFCSFINIFTSFLSLAFGVIQLRRGTAKGITIVGIICSICSVVLLFICMNIITSNPAFVDMITQGILSQGI